MLKDANPLLDRRITLTGSTLRPRSGAEKAATRDRARELLLPALEAGTVKSVVDSTFPLTEAVRAHRYMETGDAHGQNHPDPGRRDQTLNDSSSFPN